LSHPDIDDSSENVLSDWPREADPAEEGSVEETGEPEDAGPAWGTGADLSESSEAAYEPEPEPEPGPEQEEEEEDEAVADPEPEAVAAPEEGEEEAFDEDSEAFAVPMSLEHAAGDLDIPEGYAVLEGVADGGRRAVGVVVARFNGEVTSRLLARALEELDNTGVQRDAITVMVVPGAFELPVAATALAKTRRFACIVALGCVIRGDTPHFDYVASEAASGIQLAALETGVPCSFGVLTLDRIEQAEPRIEKAGEAVRSALEMADVFSHLRAAAAR
jgi:6,7-dimethyl-8-ribityllumazine synthase